MVYTPPEQGEPVPKNDSAWWQSSTQGENSTWIWRHVVPANDEAWRSRLRNRRPLPPGSPSFSQVINDFRWGHLNTTETAHSTRTSHTTRGDYAHHAHHTQPSHTPEPTRPVDGSTAIPPIRPTNYASHPGQTAWYVVLLWLFGAILLVTAAAGGLFRLAKWATEKFFPSAGWRRQRDSEEGILMSDLANEEEEEEDDEEQEPEEETRSSILGILIHREEQEEDRRMLLAAETGEEADSFVNPSYELD